MSTPPRASTQHRPSSQVVATAGHVDHGKSALVRALTGIEPDRWDEERRRGLTIDLGFAWTTLPSGHEVFFVDVPGHERFLGNMLAGLGPAAAVCFVVAADEGWQRQSADHRDAIAALGIAHGLLVITRSDLAPDRVDPVIVEARRELAGTGLAEAPAVVTSARDGSGLTELRSALDTILAAMPAPDPHARMRLWVDRSFSISGAGTVATATLSAGTLHRGDRLDLVGEGRHHEVGVRGLQMHEDPVDEIRPTARAAVNLRGVPAEAIARGDALISPGAWPLPREVDVRRAGGEALDEVPREVRVHIGTATVPARVRPFDRDHARLLLARELPLAIGDRLLLRGTGEQSVLGGVRVLDVEPPRLDRRGDGHRRAAVLAAMPDTGDLRIEVARRRAVPAAHLERLGHRAPTTLPEGLLRCGDWLVDAAVFSGWTKQLHRAVAEEHRRDALSPGLTRGAAARMLDLPDPALLEEVAGAAGLVTLDGRIRETAAAQGLGAAEPGIQQLEQHLVRSPFRAPEAADLEQWDLGSRELAAAERLGRLLRLPDGVVLLPTAPALAMRELAAIGRPFTMSEARQALATTRRVAIPLLEHLDARGWTRRLHGNLRTIVR